MTQPKSAEEIVGEFADGCRWSKDTHGSLYQPTSDWLKSALDSYREHLIEKAMPVPHEENCGDTPHLIAQGIAHSYYNKAIDEFADNLRKV